VLCRFSSCVLFILCLAFDGRWYCFFFLFNSLMSDDDGLGRLEARRSGC
jgi:hypothetical protein